MSFFDSYNGKIEEAAPLAIATGVALGILLQIGFYASAATMRIPRYNPPTSRDVVAPAFKLDRVEIDAGLLDQQKDEPRPMAKPLNEIVELKLPLERVGDESAPEEIRAAPAATRMENPFNEATKALERADLAKAADDAGAGTAKAVEAKLNAMNERVLSEGLNATGNPKLLLDPSSLGLQAPTSEQLKASAVVGSTSGAPAGFSNLDSLLTQAGPIQKGTAPILMPTDLLFDYNAFDLRSDAVDSLRKLGALIQRNPQASFLIEGHSDSFGPDDYNTWLSQQRAEAVKAWLVQAMGIDAARIGTRGLGKTRLLISPDRSVQEQQLNRRVEIVIRTR